MNGSDEIEMQEKNIHIEDFIDEAYDRMADDKFLEQENKQ